MELTKPEMEYKIKWCSSKIKEQADTIAQLEAKIERLQCVIDAQASALDGYIARDRISQESYDAMLATSELIKFLHKTPPAAEGE